MIKKSLIFLLAFLFFASSAFGEDIYAQNTPITDEINNQGRFIDSSIDVKSNENVTTEMLNENTNQYEQTTLTEVQFKPDEESSLKGTVEFKTIKNPDFSLNNKNYVTNIPFSRVSLDGAIRENLNYHVGLYSDNFDINSSEVLTDAYLYTKIIPHHTVYFGQTRISTSPDETQSLKFISTLAKSNLDENFGSFRDIGIKVGGNWDFMDYSFGVYNGGVDLPQRQNIATGGSATLKPLYKSPELGMLEVGSGFYTAPDETETKTTYGLFGKYKFKRYSVKGEYTASNNPVIKDESWYISNTFYLTNTLKLIAKHNRLNSENETINKVGLEYAVKQGRIIKLNDLKLQLNAEQITDESKQNRGRVGIKAKFSL